MNVNFEYLIFMSQVKVLKYSNIYEVNIKTTFFKNAYFSF